MWPMKTCTTTNRLSRMAWLGGFVHVDVEHLAVAAPVAAKVPGSLACVPLAPASVRQRSVPSGSQSRHTDDAARTDDPGLYRAWPKEPVSGVNCAWAVAAARVKAINAVARILFIAVCSLTGSYHYSGCPGMHLGFHSWHPLASRLRPRSNVRKCKGRPGFRPERTRLKP